MTFQRMRANEGLFSLGLLLLMIGFLACSTDDLSGFSISQESKSMTVLGGLGDVPLPTNALTTIPLTIDLKSELSSQNAEGAKAVYLEVLDLTITDKQMPEGDKDDFDFLKTISIYAESGQEDSMLNRQKIAELISMPKGVKRIQLQTDDTIDLKPYIEEGIVLTSSATGNSPEDNTSFKAEITVRVQIL